MFVRVKKVKGKEYAYLVENEWTSWGSRQRVTKYLGRAVKVEKVKTEKNVLPTKYSDAVHEAIKQELENHKFIKKDNSFINKDIEVNLALYSVRKAEKPVALSMNEGFLCDETLKRLFEPIMEDRPDAIAKKLANAFVEAGLSLSEEQFIQLFENHDSTKTYRNNP